MSEPLFYIYNATDEVYISPNPFTKAEAEQFMAEWRQRFVKQGFYASATGQGHIPIEDVELVLEPCDCEEENA